MQVEGSFNGFWKVGERAGGIIVADRKGLAMTKFHRVTEAAGSTLPSSISPRKCATSVKGGDEFAVFAAGLRLGPALERVLGQLSGGIYADGGRPEDMPADLRPSITVGAAATVRNPVTFEELYQKADEALYVAKRAGKSRATLRILD